jgi:SAM-dependent methyltransferase
MKSRSRGLNVRDRLDEYLARQRAFWNTRDLDSARFERVHTDGDRNERSWSILARRDAGLVLEGIEPHPNWTILEVGCGVGRVINELRGRIDFARYIGVDLSESMVEFARQCVGTDMRCELYVNDGCTLSMVEDGSIDFAYSVDVFIHLFDVDLVGVYLGEIRRTLKDGRRFRFNVRRWDPSRAFGPSLGGRLATFLYKTGIWSAGEHQWKSSEGAEFNGNQYTARDLRRVVARSGLRIVTMEERNSRIWCTLEKG